MNEPGNLTEAGSSINITRNNFVIQSLDLGAQINDIVAGAMPPALVRDFMHESTHHWCFTLPVGYAMAVLRHRARLALMAGPRDDTNINEVQTNEFLLHCARAALDPLAEGLALFAELDVHPGPLTSQPVMNWVALMFLRTEFEQLRSASGAETLKSAVIDTSIGQLLDTCREGNAARRVRENLLSQPLALAGNGHYLLGYMLVKCVARRLQQAHGPLAESGLVLEWVMRFFFDDARLVHILLGKERGEGAKRIVARLEERIDALFNDKAIEWFSAFAKDRIGRTQMAPSADLIKSTAQTLGIDSQEAKAARLMVTEALYRLRVSPGVDEFDSAAADWAITMRHMSSLGRIDGETVVFPDGGIRFNHQRGFLVEPGLAGVEPGVGSGTFIQFLSGNLGPCSSVSRKDEMVSIHPSAPPSEQVTKALIRPLKCYPAFDTRLRQLQQGYRKVLQKISPGLDKAVRDHTRADLERIYRRAALSEAPLARYHNLVQLMSEAGFFSLVDYDLERLRGLVALGLPGAEKVSLTRAADIRAHGKAVGLPLVEQVEECSTACF